MTTGNLITAPLPRTLIADDQPDVLAALRLLLKSEGIETELAASPEAVVAAVAERDFDLVLMDLNYARDTTSGVEGLDLIARIRALDGLLPVVAMTAWGSIELAVEAMRKGVNDFILKPWDNARLIETLRRHLQAGRELRAQRRAQTALAEARERELAEARRMQESLLPRELPRIAGGELAVEWRPAREVGGDYFDAFQLDDARIAFCIGDVMGKGMPAALLMSNVQALVKAFADIAPGELCVRVNHRLCRQNPDGRFITFFYGVFDTASRRLVFANAGHHSPMLVSRDGTSVRLAAGGMALGLFPDSQYEQGEVALRDGDRLLLFTDGLTEASSPAGEEFGEERLLNWLIEHRGLSAPALRRQIMTTIGDFSGGNFQDDATLIALAVEAQ